MEIFVDCYNEIEAWSDWRALSLATKLAISGLTRGLTP